jgi:putative cell wall-binding protein
MLRKRVSGADRYKTSVSVANTFSNGTIQNIILASGENFPDALTGSVLSKKLNAPIILVSNTLDSNADSMQYLKDHLDKSGTLYILGGEASIGGEFIDYIKKNGFSNIVRLGGSDRFDTNAKIVNFMDVPKGTPIVISNAYGFADTLSISSIASSKGYPILTTESNNLPEEIKDTIKKIQPSEVYVVGDYTLCR